MPLWKLVRVQQGMLQNLLQMQMQRYGRLERLHLWKLVSHQGQSSISCQPE